MRGIALERLSPELRETRLRTLVDELRWERDKLRDENARLRKRLEKHQLRIRAMRRERDLMDQQLLAATRELAGRAV